MDTITTPPALAIPLMVMAMVPACARNHSTAKIPTVRATPASRSRNPRARFSALSR